MQPERIRHDLILRVGWAFGSGCTSAQLENVSVLLPISDLPRDQAGSLPAGDVALVCRWVELNRDVIVDFWDGVIDDQQVHARLRRI